jgi:outer membrane protein TolC
MKKYLILVLIAALTLPSFAQTTLSLDSCRAMALRNNNQLNAIRLKQDVAKDVRKAVRTNYLPKIDAVGGYEYFSKEISLLSDENKAAFSSLGTNLSTSLGSNLSALLPGLAQNGLISPAMAQELGAIFQHLGPGLAQLGDGIGQSIVDAFHTDTRNMWMGAVTARQPIYMGGAIVAANKMADIAEKIASEDVRGMTQNTLYDIDKTYWLVVSLKQKQRLALSYRDLIQKLDNDVHKMIDEGLATRADGLKVDVKLNEADMQVTQVEDGLTLSKMLLCQLCGIPVTSDITLEDEDKEMLNLVNETAGLEGLTPDNRPELNMLEHAVELGKQNTNLTRAAFLPHVALTGGYLISNPNVFNGFEKKFAGVWNVGVLVQIPVWNWFEGVYKVRASKTATNIARLELDDAREKIDLQVEQSRFKVDEAKKRLQMATRNVSNAEENLRCANVGFREGVMESTEVMAAQTAWQMAKSQLIDAEIDVKLAQVNLKKALGVLQ